MGWVLMKEVSECNTTCVTCGALFAVGFTVVVVLVLVVRHWRKS